MSKIIVANEYTPVSTACFGWQTPKKKKTLVRKELVKKNQKSTWAREGLGKTDTYSGDLLSQMHEQTDKDLAQYRFPDQEDFKQAERRMGKRMLHTEFIKKVLSLNKRLVYEDSSSMKDSGAFYLIRNGVNGPEKVYTAACFRKGWLPEWTILKTDAADLPTGDGLTYGWRVPLQRLIQQKIITYRQVARVFGTVLRNDLCGRSWQVHVGEFMN